MKTSNRSAPRGFTLIELMVTVAIIGILASVAIPAFQLMDLRAKAAERGAIVRGIRNSINALRVKDGSFGAGLVGDWQPALPLSTMKRVFNASVPDWNKIDLMIDGATYYSYMFTAQENTPPSQPSFEIWVLGDIDGDGHPYQATYTHTLSPSSTTFVLDTAHVPSPVYEYTTF